MENLAKLLNSDEKLTFLVGAGISMQTPSQFQSARQISNAIIEYGSLSDYKNHLLLCEEIRYEYIVQQFRDFFDTDLKLLEYFMQSTSPNFMHYFLTEMLYNNQYIITTNFDCLIEESMIQLRPNDKTLLSTVILKEDFENIYKILDNPSNNHFYLFKIHGSPYDVIKNRSTKSSIITTLDTLSIDKEKSQDIFSLPKYKQKVLYKLIQNRLLVIIGYSGGDTFDIIPELMHLKDPLGIIWINHVNEKKSKDSWKIFEYNTINFSVLEQPTFLDELLWKMYLIHKIPIFKIDAHSTDFIKKNFLYSKNLENEIKNTNNIPQFNSISKFLFLNFNSPSDEIKHWFTALILKDTSNFDLSIEIYKKIIDKFEDLLTFEKKSSCYNNLGWLEQNNGNIHSSLNYYTESKRILEKNPKSKENVVCLLNIGSLNKQLGRYQDSLEFYKKALDLSDSLSELSLKAIILNNIAEIHKITKDPQTALSYFEKALNINVKIGNQQNIAVIMNNIGTLYQLGGNYPKSEEIFQKSYQILTELKDYKNLTTVLINLGNCNKGQSNYIKAKKYYEKALEFNKINNIPSNYATIANNIGTLLHYERKYKDARTWYKKALETHQILGNQHNIAICFNNLGSLDRDQNILDQAMIYFKKSKDIAEKIKDLHTKLISLNNISSIHLKQNNLDEALNIVNLALKLAENIKNHPQIAIQLNNQGKIFEMKGEKQKALEKFKEALLLFEQMNHPHAIEMKKWIQKLEKEI